MPAQLKILLPECSQEDPRKYPDQQAREKKSSPEDEVRLINRRHGTQSTNPFR